MKKNLLIGTIKVLVIALAFMLLPAVSNADKDDLEVNGFEIMPKLTGGQINKVNEAISGVSSEAGKVRKNYNEEAKKLKTSEQLASGIMTRDTILNYIVFIVQFLSQLGLLVGAGFIMYAGYKYMFYVFNGTKKPSSTLKNAIIGVVIVVFSYAIMKILTSIIGLT